MSEKKTGDVPHRLSTMLVVILSLVVLVAEIGMCQATPKPQERKSIMKNVGSKKQLFIDEEFFASTNNIELNMNPPAKTGELTIKADRPWEQLGVGGGSIVQIGQEYYLYYSANYKYPDSNEPSRRLCLAVSEDGIHWEKPSLGLVTFNRSKDNNIVFPTIEESWFCGGWVFRDTCPDVGPDEQYKMICRWSPPGTPIAEVSEWALKSADGLHWAQMSDSPAYRFSDTTNSAFWDDRIGRYVVYMRHNSDPYYAAEPVYIEGFRDGKPVVFVNNVARQQAPDDGRTYIPMAYRKVGRIETDNLALWDTPENWGHPRQTVLSFDEQDPPGIDIDNTGAIKYPWADNIYLLFPAMYYHYPGPPVGQYHNDGVFEMRLATSRDGIQFYYPSRSPFVPLGPSGEFDSGRVSMLVGIVRRGSQLYLYYTAGNDRLRHGAGGPELFKENPPVISRRVLRVDGFVSADAPYEGGEFTTVPIVFAGNSLHLNVQTSMAGGMQVELLRDGEPIAGYSAAEADVIRGNFIDRTVTWNGSSDVSALAGSPIQLRFVMRDTKLYAFQFKE